MEEETVKCKVLTPAGVIKGDLLYQQGEEIDLASGAAQTLSEAGDVEVLESLPAQPQEVQE